LRYGKLPARRFDRPVLFSAVQALPLPTAPRTFGFGRMFDDWGMLGNDQVGDCAFAGSAHETMVWTGIAHRGETSAPFDPTTVVADYSALTGYVPGEPNTDLGTDMAQLMDYRRTVGISDSTGARHKIDLAVRIDPNRSGFFDWEPFIRCVHSFACVGIGFEVPESAEQQFADGKPWDYVGDENIVGGHYVPGVGATISNSHVTVITWGKRQVMTRSFFEAYVDELWVPLSRETLAAAYIEKGLSIVDWAKVEALARSLGEADA